MSGGREEGTTAVENGTVTEDLRGELSVGTSPGEVKKSAGHSCARRLRYGSNSAKICSFLQAVECCKQK